MESINDREKENSAKGKGRRDTNLNEGAMEQSLRRNEKDTQKYERMSARIK